LGKSVALDEACLALVGEERGAGCDRGNVATACDPARYYLPRADDERGELDVPLRRLGPLAWSVITMVDSR
jgi:hypothetical protein